MGDSEKPTPEEIEKAADGLLGSLARSYGMDKNEVMGVMARKYGGRPMETTEKAAKLLGELDRHTGTGDPMDRMMQFEVIDEIRDRRETRKAEREKKLRTLEEGDDMGGKGSSGGFDMDKMMQMMMMQAVLKNMAGGEKNDTIEIMKLKILMGGGENKGDIEKLQAEMKLEREAAREDRERMLSVFTEKEEKDTLAKFLDVRDKRQEERDAMFMEELRALRTGAPKEPSNPIVQSAEILDNAKKSLQSVGAIKPDTPEERDFAIRQSAAATEAKREQNITNFVGNRLNAIEKSLDSKLESVLQAFMNEQRIRAAQAEVPIPAAPPQAPPAPPASRAELYDRMQRAAGQPPQEAQEEDGAEAGQ